MGLASPFGPIAFRLDFEWDQHALLALSKRMIVSQEHVFFSNLQNLK